MRARFNSCEVKNGGCLESTYGNGSTPDAAMAAYAERISQKLLVINATDPRRREIRAPILSHPLT